MKVKVCPECGKQNSESAWSCADCGNTLSMKTLIDTDDLPSESEKALVEISPYFKQDVEEVLETVIQGHESIIWGCNITQLTSIRFGYLLMTSNHLICVKFDSETEGNAVSTVASILNPLKALSKEVTGLNIPRPTRSFIEVFPSGSTREPLIAVNYPSYPLTHKEEETRKQQIYELDDLVSANVEEIGYSGPRLFRLNTTFKGDKKITVTFYAQHQFEKMEKLLSPWLKKKVPG